MALYLITGIGGFIGSSLARALLARGEQVRGVDNFSTGNRENLADILDRIDLREADILDLDAMHEACAGVDFVFHQAAIPSVPKSVLDPLGQQPRQHRRHRQPAGRRARRQSKARGLRGLVLRLRRHAHAAQA